MDLSLFFSAAAAALAILAVLVAMRVFSRRNAEEGLEVITEIVPSPDSEGEGEGAGAGAGASAGAADPPAPPPTTARPSTLITDEWRIAFGGGGSSSTAAAAAVAELERLQKAVAELEAKTTALKYLPKEGTTVLSGKVVFEKPIGGWGKSFQVPFVRGGTMLLPGNTDVDPEVQVSAKMFAAN